MSETVWTSTTTSTVWDDATLLDSTLKIRDIVPLEAKTRVNSTTLASKDIETIKEIVKDKLYKQLLQQLMTSGCVKIESVKNPMNQSVTFNARIELLKPKADSNETAKAA